MQKNDSRLKIGKIGKPHGIKGEVKITPLTDFPERFAGMTEVYVEDAVFKIKSVRYQNRQIILAFEGYDDRDAAAKLAGRYLLIDRSEAMPLEEDEYYIDDIIGLKVCEIGEGDDANAASDDNCLGVITGVIPTGSNDVYIIKPRDEKKREILIPALKSVVRKISLKDGLMLVKMPEEIE